ncbi:MAG: hypothetical protein R3F49_19790 [Planctomycetota bacterium]
MTFALDRSSFAARSAAGDVRASWYLLEHPELMLGPDAARAYRDPAFRPSRQEWSLRRSLYANLVLQANDAATLERFDVLGHIAGDQATGWLDPTSALAALMQVEAAHADVAIGRRARLQRARLILAEGAGVDRFEGAAARLLMALTAAPEADIATAASNALWRLSNLRPGNTVPVLCGNDSRGNEVCVREFRGRVLLLRFWSSSDVGIEATLEHDSFLVEHFWDDPVSLVGVNQDPDREEYLRQQELLGFPGDQIYEGPLADDLIEEIRARRANRPHAFESWREEASGATYLIDTHGIIRYVDPDPARLVSLIQGLVNEQYRELRQRGF